MATAPVPGIGARLEADAEAGEQQGSEEITTGLSIDGGTTFIDFDLDSIMDDEAIAMEDAFDMPWMVFFKGFVAGSLKSYKAAVWLMQRRTNPDLTPGDMPFKATRFRVRNEAAPLAEGDTTSGPATSEPSPTVSEYDPGSGDS